MEEWPLKHSVRDADGRFGTCGTRSDLFAVRTILERETSAHDAWMEVYTKHRRRLLEEQLDEQRRLEFLDSLSLYERIEEEHRQEEERWDRNMEDVPEDRFRDALMEEPSKAEDWREEPKSMRDMFVDLDLLTSDDDREYQTYVAVWAAERSHADDAPEKWKVTREGTDRVRRPEAIAPYSVEDITAPYPPVYISELGIMIPEEHWGDVLYYKKLMGYEIYHEEDPEQRYSHDTDGIFDDLLEAESTPEGGVEGVHDETEPTSAGGVGGGCRLRAVEA